MGYQRYRPGWVDHPDTSTPVSAAFLDRLETFLESLPSEYADPALLADVADLAGSRASQSDLNELDEFVRDTVFTGINARLGAIEWWQENDLEDRLAAIESQLNGD